MVKTDTWEKKWEIIQAQHIIATGKEVHLTSTEIKKIFIAK